MPFYFAKSVQAGPFRFNLSGSGIGFSVGVKGLRFGTGLRGHYVRAGVGGFYYRGTFNPGEKSSTAQESAVRDSPRTPKTYDESAIHMIEVSSGDVLAMQDERYSEILDELNAKQHLSSMALTFGCAGVGAGLVSCVVLGPVGVIGALAFGAVGATIGKRIDESRRSAVILYDLEPEAAAAYEKVTQTFDVMVACAAKWHVDAGGAVHDLHAWKRNAGASHLVDKKPTTFGYELPRVLRSNITPPVMAVGKERLYFLPDLVLVVHEGKVGAVAYDSLQIRWQDSRFIEEGEVPRDAQVVSETWKHPNKSGGPDRRFANNHRIPICLYESIHLTSGNGLNELLEVSRTGVTAPFAASLKALASTTASNERVLALPAL